MYLIIVVSVSWQWEHTAQRVCLIQSEQLFYPTKSWKYTHLALNNNIHKLPVFFSFLLFEIEIHDNFNWISVYSRTFVYKFLCSDHFLWFFYVTAVLEIRSRFVITTQPKVHPDNFLTLLLYTYLAVSHHDKNVYCYFQSLGRNSHFCTYMYMYMYLM